MRKVIPQKQMSKKKISETTKNWAASMIQVLRTFSPAPLQDILYGVPTTFSIFKYPLIQLIGGVEIEKVTHFRLIGFSGLTLHVYAFQSRIFFMTSIFSSGSSRSPCSTFFALFLNSNKHVWLCETQ